MCTAIQKKVIHNANRLVVCGLSSTGMFMDGVQLWDLPYFASLAMWLALPECSKLTEKMVDKVSKTLH